MIESLLLVLALSLDAFAASVAYGSNNIEIPFSSILVIDIYCDSLVLSGGVKPY